MNRVYGNLISPYARKVYLTLEWKGLAYEAIDVLPHSADPRFSEISRLGKIPAFEDDRVALCDSSVICDYLETRYPEPPLYPREPADRARALWLEEYADTRLQDLLLRGLVVERLIKPMHRGKPTNQARVDAILGQLLPPEIDYLESKAMAIAVEDQASNGGAGLRPSDDATRFLVGGALSIADLAITTCFINAEAADFRVDPTTHPSLATYLDGIRALPLFVTRARSEAAYMASLA